MIEVQCTSMCPVSTVDATMFKLIAIDESAVLMVSNVRQPITDSMTRTEPFFERLLVVVLREATGYERIQRPEIPISLILPLGVLPDFLGVPQLPCTILLPLLL
jgi:hypothetical protein